MKYQCVAADFPTDPSPENANAARLGETTENLDVLGLEREPNTYGSKAAAGELASDPYLSVVCAYPAQPTRQPKCRGPYRAGGCKYLSVTQATNTIEAVNFAKLIGLPLVAHATIHWSGTIAFDDPDGIRFTKVREGLSKVLVRRGIATAWAWSRECKSHTDIVHCHLLFHLPVEYRTKRKLQVEAAIYHLFKRHGRGYWAEQVIDLRIHDNPDGKYLIKGGGPKV